MDLLELEQEPAKKQILLKGAPEIRIEHLDYTYPGGLEKKLAIQVKAR